MAITLRAGATANGINFTTYYDKFFPPVDPNSGHSGSTTFYGGSQFAGDQIGIDTPDDKLVLIGGSDLEYTFAVHRLSGTINTVSFGSYGSNSSIDGNGLLVGTVSELSISGLKISNPVGSAGDTHKTVYGLMYGEPDELLSFVNAQAQIVHGSKGNDVYVGTKFNDKVYGYAGNDTLDGGAGNDLIKGGAGNDKIYGGEGNDTLYGDGGNDTIYGGAGNDKLLGGVGNDKLFGDEGNDTLTGGAGNDILTGGAGRDTLIGGAGRDIFRYLDTSDSTVRKSGMDLIRDFNGKDDRIDLRGIDADEGKAGNQAFKFLGDADFTGKAGELIYDIKGKHTYVSGDTDGDGNADFMIDLLGKHTLDKGDFLL